MTTIKPKHIIFMRLAIVNAFSFLRKKCQLRNGIGERADDRRCDARRTGFLFHFILLMLWLPTATTIRSTQWRYALSKAIDRLYLGINWHCSSKSKRKDKKKKNWREARQRHSQFSWQIIPQKHHEPSEWMTKKRRTKIHVVAVYLVMPHDCMSCVWSSWLKGRRRSF